MIRARLHRPENVGRTSLDGRTTFDHTASKPSSDVLVVDQIHKSFGPLDVLKGISVAAKKHEVISILGSSGSGKSTFLRCVNLLERPDSGTIQVSGEPLSVARIRAPVTILMPVKSAASGGI